MNENGKVQFLKNTHVCFGRRPILFNLIEVQGQGHKANLMTKAYYGMDNDV